MAFEFYFQVVFNSTESRTVEISRDNPTVSISCVANTSQPCNYRWRGTSMSAKNPIEIHGQTIDMDLFKQDFEDMRCSAECRIRDKDCTVEPLLLIFSRTEGDIFLVSHWTSSVVQTGDALLYSWYNIIIAEGIPTVLSYHLFIYFISPTYIFQSIHLVILNNVLIYITADSYREFGH